MRRAQPAQPKSPEIATPVPAESKVSGVPEPGSDSLTPTSTSAEPLSSLPARSRDAEMTTPVGSPDTRSKGGSVRRSLQKTLRDPGSSGSVYRHRRGKDGDSHTRTLGGSGGAANDEQTEEGTPSLQREGKRFILHGKQASVIQFGSEWSERMKQQQEAFQGLTEVHSENEDISSWPPPILDAPFSSPLTGSKWRRDSEFSEQSNASAQSYGFREDAQTAEAYAMGDAEIRPSVSSDGLGITHGEESATSETRR